MRLTQVAAAGALTAAVLAGALATGPPAGARPVAKEAAAATAPKWRMQAPPERAGTTNQAFGAVSCSSASACLALAGTTACTAIGESATGKGAPALLAERWSGSAWKIQPVPGQRLLHDR